MKNLFNNISQEEKNRILEMHKGHKMVFSEQIPPTNTNTSQQTTASTPQKQTSVPYEGTIKVGDYVIYDGQKVPSNAVDTLKNLQQELGVKPTGILDQITLDSFKRTVQLPNNPKLTVDGVPSSVQLIPKDKSMASR